MSNGIVSVRGWVIALTALTLMAGCGNEGNPMRSSIAGRPGQVIAPLETQETAGRDALRIAKDTARGRLWLLGVDDVRVYDARKKLIRQVILPSWSVARFVCSPDMVLDSSGSAVISSNLPARLWRIDANSFEVKKHEISLQGREHWDIGFGSLAFAADGTLFAVTSLANSLWKIDIATESASMVEFHHPPLKSCTVPAQLLR